MSEFRMPSLGADMESGRVVEWLVGPGDVVHHGDVVAVVDTDKAEIEVEVFADGVVREILVGIGETVAVGTPLATIDPPGAPAAAPTTTAPAARTSSPAEAAVPLPAEPLTAPVPSPAPPATPEPAPAASADAAGDHAVHSPVLRRLAHHLGVDIATVHGTGFGGSVTRADIEAAATAPGRPEPTAAPTASPEAAEAPDRAASMRSAVATLMTRSKREIPHYTLATTVDFRAARDWLTQHNAQAPVAERVLPVALIAVAVARAAREAPEMNGTFVDGAFVPSERVNLGIAISLRGGGVIAPAIRDADRLAVPELMSHLRDLVSRARAFRLRAGEMADGTLTLTNVGDANVRAVLPVIYPPQVAIVGVGAVLERPWAVDGLLGVHPVVDLTVAADHRVSDGMRGARFLARIDQLLQEPEAL